MNHNIVFSLYTIRMSMLQIQESKSLLSRRCAVSNVPSSSKPRSCVWVDNTHLFWTRISVVITSHSLTRSTDDWLAFHEHVHDHREFFRLHRTPGNWSLQFILFKRWAQVAWMVQASSFKSGKQEQKQSSPNLGSAFQPSSVMLHIFLPGYMLAY